MASGRHIDRICLIVTLCTVFLSGAFIVIGRSVSETVPNVLQYEKRLFDHTRVHEIEIVMDDWDEFLKTCENEEYSPAALVIDGESFKNVGFRAKGNTSLRNVSSMGSQRYSFKIEFDHYESGKTYFGLDKLCLNNLIQDNTMLKDFLSYQLMRDFGADAPLCSFVYLKVNGEDWGLYLAVEGVEDSFLKRVYGSEPGNLYKPDSQGFGGGPGNGQNFNMEAFEEGNPDMFVNPPQSPQDNELLFENNVQNTSPMPPDGGFPGRRPDGDDMGRPGDPPGGMGSADVKLQYIDDDLESYSNIFSSAKTDITKGDKERLIRSLKQLSEVENLEEILDTEEVLRYFVVHNFLCNGDSYTGGMIHNYYLHEKEGQLSMIPWDYNLAFGTFEGGSASDSVNALIDSPVSGGQMKDRPMVNWIFTDITFTDRYHALFEEFIDRWFTDGNLTLWIDELQTLLRSYVEKDPTKFCTLDAFENGISSMKRFAQLRAESVERQLKGLSADVDASELNLSDMGSMGRPGGGPEEPSPDFAQNPPDGMNPPAFFGGGMPPQGDEMDSSNGNPPQSVSEGSTEAVPAEPVVTVRSSNMGGGRPNFAPPPSMERGFQPVQQGVDGKTGGTLLAVSLLSLIIGFIVVTKVRH